MLCCRWRSQQQGSCPRVCGILGPVCLWINQYFMQEVHAFCWGGASVGCRPWEHRGVQVRLTGSPLPTWSHLMAFS